MKILKNKKKAKFYYVTESFGLFGDFSDMIKTKIYAISPENAINRYLRKKQEYSLINYYKYKTERKWATFRVVPFNKPYERFALYFKG